MKNLLLVAQPVLRVTASPLMGSVILVLGFGYPYAFGTPEVQAVVTGLWPQLAFVLVFLTACTQVDVFIAESQKLRAWRRVRDLKEWMHAITEDHTHIFKTASDTALRLKERGRELEAAQEETEQARTNAREQGKGRSQTLRTLFDQATELGLALDQAAHFRARATWLHKVLRHQRGAPNEELDLVLSGEKSLDAPWQPPEDPGPPYAGAMAMAIPEEPNPPSAPDEVAQNQARRNIKSA